ncbi:hypothetical protein SPI_07469 [Niveomyces insectorum RCEF 264]|uniref:Uncharacterized protein n=1 Tax=Niveomyces insectorum RCEF 264 TaxID=1081102 RepID=A0A167PW77_9HYPO|nr:hypothetical protein SPI_07469 [Niveomyces insectorum RCEF 264]
MDHGLVATETYNHESQQVDAMEALAYARENDLFLGFETSDHLGYHHGVAAAEHLRMSRPERSLSHGHLRSLEIPQTSVAEAWTVPRRVAGVIESACRCLTADEQKSLEEKFCARPQKRNSALERPLLLSDPDEDSAELQRTAISLIDNEEHVRKYNLSRDVQGVEPFAVPEHACELASRLENSFQTEKMTISEQVVRLLVSMMNSMKWTDSDEAALLEQQTRYKSIIPQKCISPPLTPVSFPIDFFVPDGDVCLVSDASDFSSHGSEAVEQAERVATEKTGEVWSEDGGIQLDIGTSGVSMSAAVSPLSLDGLNELQKRLPEMIVQKQEETSLAPSSVSTGSNPSTERTDDARNCIPDVQLYDSIHQEPLFAVESSPKFESESSHLGLAYGEVTAETLLGLEDSNSVVLQAKMAVPTVGVNSSLPAWNDVSADALNMFHWIAEDTKEAFDSCHGEHDGGQEKEIFDSEVLQRRAEIGQAMLENSLDVDEPPLLASCLGDLSETLEPLLEIIRCMRTVNGCAFEEGFLEEPHEERQAPTKRPDAASWGDLMGRWKRRKQDNTEISITASSQDGPTTPSPSTQVIFKAPELLLGFNAFANLPCQPAQPESPKRSIGHNNELNHHPLPESEEELSSSSPVPPIDASDALPKLIFSIAVPRLLRAHIFSHLPTLDFVERDYQQYGSKDDASENDDADISIFPAIGIVMITMVGLRQSSGQRTSAFQKRVAKISAKYDHLRVLVYRNNKMTGDSDDLPELSPSDAMAIVQLQGFSRNLACRVSVHYVSGGERAVARWAASLICRRQPSNDKDRRAERFLAEAELTSELVLRRAGLNAYDAQIVLGVFQELGIEDGRKANTSAEDCVSQFMRMSPEERLQTFGSEIGCCRALENANISIHKSTSSNRACLLLSRQ